MHASSFSPYQSAGFAGRKAYLASLAEEYGEVVYALAADLGPSEDFDASPDFVGRLITMLEDCDGL